jgi:hypothetical protein
VATTRNTSANADRELAFPALDWKEPHMMRCRSPLVLASVVTAVAFGLLAAGCGGGSPGVAGVASSTTAVTTTQSGPLAFAGCMRSNGVPNFPDPDGSGGIPKPRVVAASEANPNKFRAAQTACNHLLPNGSLAPQQTAQQQRTRLADELSFARCMRSHGVARFPDPTAQGELTLEMLRAQGIDLHSPAVLRAVQACLPASHGALTPAKVRAALKEAGG